MILQRAGDHFGGGGGTPVDEDHKGGAVEDVAVVGHESRLGFGVPTFGVDDQPLVEKLVGDIHRRPQDAAGIVAKIDDQPAQVSCAFVGEPLHGGAQVLRRLVLELGDADIAIAGFDQSGTHAVDADFRAHQVEIERCRRAIAPHPQVDACARFAAQAADSLADRAPLERGVIHFDHGVARA